jgi:proteasome assembly chaperone 3
MQKSKTPSVAQFSIMVEGFHTEIICQSFSDRLVIIITQLGKPGTFLTSMKESNQFSSEDIFETKVLFGKRDSRLNDILSRLIINDVSKKTTKPILFSLAFDPKFEKEAEEKGVKQYLSPIITTLFEKCCVW